MHIKWRQNYANYAQIGSNLMKKKIIDVDTKGLEYLKTLDADNNFKIDVDPDNFYDLSPEHKAFIGLYVEYRNLGVVSQLMNLDILDSKRYFTAYATQKEIRRITAALYHRQAATKIIAFEELGAYLSGWLVGGDIVESDQLTKSEKIQVVRLLMEWHKSMKEFAANPTILTTSVIEEELKNLSVANIKQLIHTDKMLSSKKISDKKEDLNINKQNLIDELNIDNSLTNEEIKYLESLPVKELFLLLKGE
jgi:hypothetical protein